MILKIDENLAARDESNMYTQKKKKKRRKRKRKIKEMKATWPFLRALFAEATLKYLIHQPNYAFNLDSHMPFVYVISD